MNIFSTWDNCVVHLNSDSTGSFYSGDIVTGLVTLEFKQLQNVKRIDFIVIGISTAKWTRPSPTMPHIKIYSEKRKVLYINIDLFNNLHGKTVRPGLYDFPFHFVLPEDVPSTFKSKIANVKYFIKIKSQGFCAQKKIIPFVVLGNVNLNHIEDYLEPIYKETYKTFWNHDSISFSVKSFKGFASKQRIPIEITIFNEKQVKIQKLSIFLIQNRRYNVSAGYALQEKKMFQIDYAEFLNMKNETCLLHMEIPALTPSSINVTNPMIDISYLLRVKLKFLLHSTLFEDIPVTVATHPVIHSIF